MTKTRWQKIKIMGKNSIFLGRNSKTLFVFSENAGIKIKSLVSFSESTPANLDITTINPRIAIRKTKMVPVNQEIIGKQTIKALEKSDFAPINHKKAMEKNKISASPAKRRFLIAFSVVILLLANACVKHPQLLYFRNQSEFVPLQGHEIANQLRIKIQTDDVLSIMVRALDQETAEPFNLFSGTGQQIMGQLALNNPSLMGYLVDPNGNIDFPVLGRLNLAGLTVDEAKALLAKQLQPYLKDPVIILRFMNFRFTVLGEVKAPRTISVPGERMTILEALGQAGDLTPYSNREKIMVIRENNGAREFGYINIHSPEVFQSPYFYLQQNDIVYVEPIPEAVATVRDPIQEVLPIVSGILSIIAVVVALAR